MDELSELEIDSQIEFLKEIVVFASRRIYELEMEKTARSRAVKPIN